MAVGEFVGEPPEAFSHLGFALRNATDLESVAQAVVRELVALPGAVRAGLALVEGGGRRLRFRVSDSDEWCHIDAYDDVPLTAVVRSGSPIVGALDDRAQPGGAKHGENDEPECLAGGPLVCSLYASMAASRFGE